MTLATISAAFDGLSEEHQLMMLDYLACRTEYADQVFDGLRNAAIAYGRTVDEEDAVAVADGIIPQFENNADWKAHVAMRDNTLEHALSYHHTKGKAS